MSKEEKSINIVLKVIVDAILLCALGVCVYAVNFLWQPFKRGFFCGDETLMFPYRANTVSVLVLRLIQSAPVPIFVLCEWISLRRDQETQLCFKIPIPKWIYGFYCILVSYGLGIILVELCAAIAKSTIGRPRPHFFDVCKPSVNCSSEDLHRRYIQPDEYNCTGDATDHQLKDMQLSFLSGHAAACAFSMIYFALYLDSRMTWRGTRVLRHTIQFLAVMISWFTALSRVSDNKHHWSDVLAGYIMGLVFAVLLWRWGTDLVQEEKTCTPVPYHNVSIARQRRVEDESDGA